MGIEDFKQKRINLEKSRVDRFNSVFDIYNEYNKHVRIKMKKLFEFSDYDIEEWLNSILDNIDDATSNHLNLMVLSWKAYKSHSRRCDIAIGNYTRDYISEALHDIDNELYTYNADKNFLYFHHELEKEQLDRLMDYFILSKYEMVNEHRIFIPRIDVASLKENMKKWVYDVINKLENFGLNVYDVDDEIVISDALDIRYLQNGGHSDSAEITGTPEIVIKNPMKE